ncbi:methylisocitrate lyase [Singulisphaera sp. PoT]|uniref:methylisocitrate lyase n=1 Tax=Singulisphaera sp. PoT TaxID=3411797 RepID=UPI003BF60CC8
MPSPGARLRAAWAEESVMIPGTFNALTAKMAERLGYRAVYLSGGALSAGWAGLPDIGLLSLTEFVDQAAVIARATNLPLLCDADTGFGEAINVERTVRLFEQAGVAGIHLEDQVLPKRCGHLSGKSVVDTSTMVAKIRAAVAARKDPDFVIVARTDARNVESFESAVDRAHAYLEAGADMIFPEALESVQEFAAFAEQVEAPKLANMTEFGKSPMLSMQELATFDYRAVLFPLTAFRVAMRAAEDLLRELKERGTQRDLLDRMQKRSELYEVLGYQDWEAKDRAYFGGDDASDEPTSEA